MDDTRSTRPYWAVRRSIPPLPPNCTGEGRVYKRVISLESGATRLSEIEIKKRRRGVQV